MTAVMSYPLTHQGVRDLDNPIRPNRMNAEANEQALCALGGAMLAGYGLGRGDLCGLLLAATGGILAYRGMTGPW